MKYKKNYTKTLSMIDHLQTFMDIHSYLKVKRYFLKRFNKWN